MFCKHLNHSNKVGFHEAFETFENMDLSDDEDFQAWCDTCEITRESEEEWGKLMAVAEIKLFANYAILK